MRHCSGHWRVTVASMRLSVLLAARVTSYRFMLTKDQGHVVFRPKSYNNGLIICLSVCHPPLYIAPSLLHRRQTCPDPPSTESMLLSFLSAPSNVISNPTT